MVNLEYMIDVDASECAVPADKIREMDVVHSLQDGSKGVNALVAGVSSTIYSPTSLSQLHTTSIDHSHSTKKQH